jgi:hypothetical protein
MVITAGAPPIEKEAYAPQTQTPQQRRANARFAKSEEDKRGKPQSQLKGKREVQKSPISMGWMGAPLLPHASWSRANPARVLQPSSRSSSSAASSSRLLGCSSKGAGPSGDVSGGIPGVAGHGRFCRSLYEKGLALG